MWSQCVLILDCLTYHNLEESGLKRANWT